MRLEGKVSKVAVCTKCNNMLSACHIDYIEKETEKEFTEFTNKGFLVKIETIKETKAREFGDYLKCHSGNC